MYRKKSFISLSLSLMLAMGSLAAPVGAAEFSDGEVQAVQQQDAEAKKAMAEAVRFAREQEAEGIRATGLAEAEAIRAKATAEAEGIDKKAEAMKNMERPQLSR